jgi:hypothetical protein
MSIIIEQRDRDCLGTLTGAEALPDVDVAPGDLAFPDQISPSHEVPDARHAVRLYFLARRRRMSIFCVIHASGERTSDANAMALFYWEFQGFRRAGCS